MASPRAFIALEKTMSAHLHAEWGKLAQTILGELHQTLTERRWNDAHALADRLTMKDVVTNVRPKIEELAVSALLFGAHHVSGSVRATKFMNGAGIPAETQGAINQLVEMVENDATAYVCNQLHAAITAMQRADVTTHFQKDDVSEEQLEETGGLQEPEQRGKRKKLYVHRDLKNPAEFLAWAKQQGFKTTIPVEDLHVTVLYSKTPVDWGDMGDHFDEIRVTGGVRKVEQFGGGAVVLEFACPELAERHYAMRDKGATSDFPDYRSHMTITYDLPEDLDLSKVEPFEGVLEFGPEVFEEITKGGFNPDDMTEELLKREALRKAEAAKSLADQLNDAVMNGGKVAIDTSANLTTSRLVSLGFLSEAQHSGVQQYVVNEVLDGKTCPVCRYMHGKRFNVGHEYGRLMQCLGTSDPAELRSLAPWPGQGKADLQDLYAMSSEEMQAAGFGSPPYHPGCRGMMHLEGTVDEEIPLGGGDLAQEATNGLQMPDTTAGVEPEQVGLPVEKLWTGSEVDKLKWRRFDITDPNVFKLVDEAIDAGQYDAAQAMIDQWEQGSLPVLKDEEFEDPSPYAAKKRRKERLGAGLAQDYDDIRPDSTAIDFEHLVSGDQGRLAFRK